MCNDGIGSRMRRMRRRVGEKRCMTYRVRVNKNECYCLVVVDHCMAHTGGDEESVICQRYHNGVRAIAVTVTCAVHSFTIM